MKPPIMDERARLQDGVPVDAVKNTVRITIDAAALLDSHRGG